MTESPKPEKVGRPKAYRYLYALTAVVAVLAIAEVVYEYHRAAKPPTNTPTPTVSAVASPKGTQHFESQGHVHDPQLVKVFDYNSNPPTSGPHDEVYPPAVVNEKPIANAALIHMLEHGNIVVVYNALPAAELAQLKKWVDTKNGGSIDNQLETDAEEGKLVFLCPWPSIPKGSIDALAWTRLYAMTKFDPTNLGAFVKAWQLNEVNMIQ